MKKRCINLNCQKFDVFCNRDREIKIVKLY